MAALGGPARFWWKRNTLRAVLLAGGSGGKFQAHHVALVCPSQGIDTSNANPAAMLQINVRAAVAQLEREIITERVKAGIAPPGRAG